MNVSLLTPKRYWQARGWIYRSGSQSVHVKALQPNSPSPCQPYATLTPISAIGTLKPWREAQYVAVLSFLSACFSESSRSLLAQDQG